MSCPGGICLEPGRRRRALILLGLMMLVFIVLSGFSFIKSRGQVTPNTVTFGAHHATDGKRVFQAYGCMGCHTIVGNGAYFAPDLTKEYQNVGPAWLAAFLHSAGSWPTEVAVLTQLQNKDIAEAAGVDNIEDYYQKYPGAKTRVERRGGQNTFMPNLRFRANEVGQLIAFLKYTSAMNTEGWPPAVKTGPLPARLERLYGRSVATGTTAAPAPASAGQPTAAAESPAERGAQHVQTFGCTACHSPEDKKIIGPPWRGIYGSKEKLADGTTVTVDDAYIIESILKPTAKTVDGYPEGTMPTYEGLLNDEQIQEIIAYIKTL